MNKVNKLEMKEGKLLKKNLFRNKEVKFYIRDEIGLFLGARSAWVEPIFSMPSCWIKERGFDNFTFTIDSKIVDDAFNSKYARCS